MVNYFHSSASEQGGRRKRAGAGAAVCLAALIGLLAPGRAAKADPPDTVYVIPHTHWEGAVFKTREEYLEIGLPNIVKALYLLKKYPEYRFVLDQMCYVRPFVERYPAEVAALREFLSQGRLQIAGGTDTMHDNNIPSGESIVRQYLLGKVVFSRALGYEVTTGWGLDTFGHNAQMPQILKLAGMHSYWFQRGVPGIDTPSEFLWQGIDGTKIPAFWLPIGYGGAARHSCERIGIRRSWWKAASMMLTPFSHGHERVLMAGADVWEPEEETAADVAEGSTGRATRRSSAGWRCPRTTRRGRETHEEPVISGELNPIFQGVYSSRIEVKQAMRNMERSAHYRGEAERDGGRAGSAPDREEMEQAWEPVLFNQAHDLTFGRDGG